MGLSHLASQWVDLSRDNHPKSAKLNMALQLCAKLGHTPYVLEASTPSETSGGPLICGLDVCHLNDPQGGPAAHVTAGLQLRRANGEVLHAYISYGRILGESIPS